MAEISMTGIDIYDPYQHPEEWTPEMYKKLEQARDIIEEWWLPNRRQLDKLGGVMAMTEMSDVYYGMHKQIINDGFYGRVIPKKYGGPGWNIYQCGLLSAEITKMAFTPRMDDAFAYGGANFVLPGPKDDDDRRQPATPCRLKGIGE